MGKARKTTKRARKKPKDLKARSASAVKGGSASLWGEGKKIKD